MAGAADLQISPGRVDPPDYPAASILWSWQRLQRAWGPPIECVFGTDCTRNSNDIALYPFGLSVLKAARIRYFQVSSTAWSTPEGIRRMNPVAQLTAAYGSRLLPVENLHRFVGMGSGMQRLDGTNYMILAGANALGFTMASGRVSTILTGPARTIRETLAMYGPI